MKDTSGRSSVISRIRLSADLVTKEVYEELAVAYDKIYEDYNLLKILLIAVILIAVVLLAALLILNLVGKNQRERQK